MRSDSPHSVLLEILDTRLREVAEGVHLCRREYSQSSPDGLYFLSLNGMGEIQLDDGLKSVYTSKRRHES